MKIVIDANVVLALATTLPYSSQAEQQMRIWENEKTEIFVPSLWVYEVMTSIRKLTVGKMISPENALKALDYIFALDIQQIHPTPEAYKAIFDWTIRLNQNQAYDAAYLALAEQLEANFWTADKRLVNRAKQLKLNWVHKIG